MPVSKYQYAGTHLCQQKGTYDVQHQDMGVLELDIDPLVPNGKQQLI